MCVTDSRRSLIDRYRRFVTASLGSADVASSPIGGHDRAVTAALRPDLERFWMTRRENLFDEHCR